MFQCAERADRKLVMGLVFRGMHESFLNPNISVTHDQINMSAFLWTNITFSQKLVLLLHDFA